MATTLQQERVRVDLGLADTTEINAAIDFAYVRALEDYPSDTAASEVQARIYIIKSLLSQAIKRPDYIANEKNISMSQIRIGLKDLLKEYQDELKKVDGTSEVQFGSLHPPERIKDYPDSFWTRRWR